MGRKRITRLRQQALAHYGELLNDYITWLYDFRNSSEETIKKHRRYITIFLNWVSYSLHLKKVSLLSHGEVERFFLKYSDTHEFPSREQMQSALRVFLRFCNKEGYTERDLSIAVPTLRTYKLAKIPQVISKDDIKKVLETIDRTTKSGRRDYAIILLLTTYGVRSKQIRKLRLSDINWRKNTIHFSSMKFGKGVLQPLLPDVGEALLDYLQNGRRPCSCPEVFIRVLGACKPIGHASTISGIIERRALAAGVTFPMKGSHIFRHEFANRMLESGHSLKSLADMLGHRCLQTTYIYTKVDFQHLSNVPLEWPEDIS